MNHSESKSSLIEKPTFMCSQSTGQGNLETSSKLIPRKEQIIHMKGLLQSKDQYMSTEETLACIRKHWGSFWAVRTRCYLLPRFLTHSCVTGARRAVIVTAANEQYGRLPCLLQPFPHPFLLLQGRTTAASRPCYILSLLPLCCTS